MGWRGPVGAYRTRLRLFTLLALPSFGKGDSNSLLIWIAFLCHLGDVFGDCLV